MSQQQQEWEGTVIKKHTQLAFGSKKKLKNHKQKNYTESFETRGEYTAALFILPCAFIAIHIIFFHGYYHLIHKTKRVSGLAKYSLLGSLLCDITFIYAQTINYWLLPILNVHRPCWFRQLSVIPIFFSRTCYVL